MIHFSNCSQGKVGQVGFAKNCFCLFLQHAGDDVLVPQSFV